MGWQFVRKGRKVRSAYLWLIAGVLLVACSQAGPPPAAATQPAAAGNPSLAGLGLQGGLILIVPGQNGPAIERMDLGSGTLRLVFQAPPQALISTALVSPDGKQVLLAYAPPPSEQNQLVYTSLYLLALDGASSPKPLFGKPPENEAFFAPVWAPDGKSIYTSHFHRGNDTSPDRFTIDQVSMDGQLHPLIQDAQWPSLSPDGTSISYVSTSENGNNNLYLAGIDGSNPHRALPEGEFLAVDDHFYTPDGKTIVFSAVNPPPAATPSAWKFPFGVQVVSAHNVPSDWYALSLETGKTTRLTNLSDTGMYAALSPDEKKVAFIAQSGIYAMNLDGSQLTQLSDQAATGTVDWVR